MFFRRFLNPFIGGVCLGFVWIRDVEPQTYLVHFTQIHKFIITQSDLK